MNRLRARRTSGGFSLVEMMIALVVGLILVAGVLNIQANGRRGHKMNAELLLLQERGRYAMELMTRDIRRSGYLGGNGDATTVIGRSELSASATCANDGSWARLLERPLYGLDDADADYPCMPTGSRNRGDVLAVHYAAERTATVFADDRPYLRTSLFRGEVFDGRNDDTTVVEDRPVSTRELKAHAYYLGPSSRICPDGSQVNALHRMQVGDDGRPVAELLLHGVDQLQARYGVDIDGDGSSDQYLSAAEISASVNRRWEDVRAVRLWIVVASECPQQSYVDTRTYDLGEGTTYQPGDRLRRQVFTTTVAIRN